MPEETEIIPATPAKHAHGGAIPAKHPIKCGYKNCKFKSVYATVVGMHRSQRHGIKGRSTTANYIRKSKKPPGVCPQCGEGPLKALADHMRNAHGIFKRRGRPAKQEEITLNGNSTNSTNEVAIAFWVSRTATLVEQLFAANAERVDLTTEDFTARVLAVFSGSSKTLRERYRLSHRM